MAEVSAPAGGVDDSIQSDTTYDCALRFSSTRQHPDGGTTTQRVAPEIVVGEPEVLHQCKTIIRKHVRKICSSLVRFVAITVAAQIRHHHAIAERRDPGGMPVAYPVDGSRREEAMDEH